ncbi:MAG: O-antigen ligase family protein [Patescibacteria group bacterium]|jgi:O-antigen ligase
MYILIIILALAFAIVSWKRPLWGAYIIAAGLPSFLLRYKILGIPMTMLETMVLVLFLICLVRRQIDFKKVFANPLFWPMMAILFVATISVWASPDRVGGLGIWKAYFVEPMLFVAILASQIRSRKALEGLFWALGASIIYLAIIGLFQQFTAWNMPQAFLKADGGVDRIVSILNYPNALGLYCGPIIILYLGWLFAGGKKAWEVVGKLLVLALGAVTILLAHSYGAIISVAVVSWVMGLVYRKTRMYVVGLTVLAGLAWLFSGDLRSLIMAKLFAKDYSLFVRSLIWKETWEMLKDNWFWGAGLDGYSLKILPYHLKTFEVFPYPHNILFNFWSELGILGVLAFVFLFVKYVWLNAVNFFKGYGSKILSFTFVAIIIQMIIHGLVDVPYFKNDLSMLFWIIMVMAVINRGIVWNSKEELTK